MQAFARGAFFGVILARKMRPFFVRIVLTSLLEPRERRRSEKSSLRLSRLSLDDKEQCILWRGIAYCLDFFYAIGTEGIKAHTVLGSDKIITQL